MISALRMQRSPAACRVDTAIPAPVLAVTVSEVADQQTGKRASSCANQSTFSAICDTADDGAGCCAHGDVSLVVVQPARAATAVTAIMSFRIF